VLSVTLTECLPAVFAVHQQDHTGIFCLSVSLLPLLWHSTSASPSGGQQHHSHPERGKPAETLHNHTTHGTSTNTHTQATAGDDVPVNNLGRRAQWPQRFRLYAGKIQL